MDPLGFDDGDHFEVGFEQFRLRPGLEMEVCDEAGRALHRAQFVMAHPVKGVLVSIRASDPEQIAMQPGARYRLSGFNGRFDFSFQAQAQKVDRSQFTALLAPPATVNVHFVRKHERMPLALPATVAAASGSRAPVTVRNLSMGGAGVSSVQPLGAQGDSVALELPVHFENQDHLLKLRALIRRTRVSDESLMFDAGLEFADTSLTDKLLLHYYITTLMNDYSLV
jgi:hypothetical protein